MWRWPQPGHGATTRQGVWIVMMVASGAVAVGARPVGDRGGPALRASGPTLRGDEERRHTQTTNAYASW